MRYDAGVLTIEDLNPEVRTRWRMNRIEMLRTGLRFILAALRR